MQQVSSSRKFLSTIKKIVFICFFAGVFFLGLWEMHSVIKVQNIVIEGGNNSTVLRGLSSYYGNDLIFLQTKEVQKSLLNNNPQLKSANAIKKFPDSLLITVSFQPVLGLLEMNDGYAYLSENGKIIQKSRDKNNAFPLIRYYQKMNYSFFSAGDDMKYIDIVFALHFIKKTSELGLKTDTVDINGLDMLLFTIGDKKLYFTTEKDLKTQDYELDQIIKQFKIERKDFKSLDLRFEKPIITF